jgi:SAM-dependent methyltransferase
LKQQLKDAWLEGTDWDFHLRQFTDPYKSTVAFADFLERHGLPRANDRVLDACCGMGGIAYYLANRFPSSTLSGMELNTACVEKGRNHMSNLEGVIPSLFQADVFSLDGDLAGRFDGVTCLATLSWLPNAEAPVRALAALNPQWIAVSSLFTDTLVEAQIVTKDFSRPYGGFPSTDKFYNIYTIERTKLLFKELGYNRFYSCRFNIDTDLPKPSHGGMGTYTEKLESGQRLQISGPVLMSWYFILARKDSSQ